MGHKPLRFICMFGNRQYTPDASRRNESSELFYRPMIKRPFFRPLRKYFERCGSIGATYSYLNGLRPGNATERRATLCGEGLMPSIRSGASFGAVEQLTYRLSAASAVSETRKTCDPRQNSNDE